MQSAGGGGPLQAPADPKLQGQARSRTYFPLGSAVALILLPTVAFAFVTLLFMNVYYQMAHLVLFLLAIGTGICIVQVVMHFDDTRGGSEAPESQQRRTFVLCLAAMTLIAQLLASVVGISVYENYVKQYWFLHNSNTYTNVLPSEAAEGYLDAGKVLFSDGSRVEVQKAIGYKDITVYCAAPILDDMKADRVQFWAVGTDCCGQQGSFDCDDAWNPKAKGGVAMKVDADNRWDSNFGKAVRQAEAAYNLASAADVLFLRWVVNPQEVEDNYWLVAKAFALGSCAVFALVAMITVLAINTAFQKFLRR